MFLWLSEYEWNENSLLCVVDHGQLLLSMKLRIGAMKGTKKAEEALWLTYVWTEFGCSLSTSCSRFYKIYGWPTASAATTCVFIGLRTQGHRFQCLTTSESTLAIGKSRKFYPLQCHKGRLNIACCGRAAPKVLLLLLILFPLTILTAVVSICEC